MSMYVSALPKDIRVKGYIHVIIVLLVQFGVMMITKKGNRRI